jgi:MipA family protein
MRSFTITAALAGLLLGAAACPLAAEEPAGASVTLGLGAGLSPAYFGAGTTRVGPAGAISIQRIVLPGGFGFGSDSALLTDPGFGPRGAFRFVPSREASGNAELQGLGDIDEAVELGLGAFRITERARVYAEVRRGFGGHDGWVAEVGVDAILRPSDRLVLTAGPRAHWGDADFVGTYFGVTAGEAAGSAFQTYKPDGGLVSLGVELNARYDFRNGWGLHGTLGWRQLQGDAARSPITEQGSREQVGARLVVTRSFGFGD